MSGEVDLIAAVIDQLVKDCVSDNDLLNRLKEYPRVFWPVMVTSLLTRLTPEQLAEGIADRVAALISSKQKGISARPRTIYTDYEKLAAKQKRWEKRQQEKLSHQPAAKAS